MSDDWSLKNKKKLLADCMRPISLNDKPHRDYFFKEEDIETLRQKLIEDIITKSGEFALPLGQIDIINIINNRFGVEK